MTKSVRMQKQRQQFKEIKENCPVSTTRSASAFNTLEHFIYTSVLNYGPSDLSKFNDVGTPELFLKSSWETFIILLMFYIPL